MESKSFTLKREEVKVDLDGSEYVLVELDGRERDRYLNALTSRLQPSRDGKGGSVKNFDGLQASLVAASLFKVEGTERVSVPIDDVQAYPAKTLSDLFGMAKELSALSVDDDDDEAGND